MNRATFWHALATVASATAMPLAARAAALDPNYVAALECAEDFLGAWRKRDAAGGLALLSAQAKRGAGAANARAWLVGTSSPMNGAFEISGGHALSASHYRFTLKLYYALTGGGLDVPQAQHVDVVRTGAKWYVAALPA